MKKVEKEKEKMATLANVIANVGSFSRRPSRTSIGTGRLRQGEVSGGALAVHGGQ